MSVKDCILDKNSKEINALDDLARKAFYEAMKKKADDIGMKGTTTFSNASGLNDAPYNRTTIQDLVKMVIHASTVDRLYPIWNTPSYKLKDRKGEKFYNLISTYTNPEYDPNILDFAKDYYILGAKTGTTSIASFVGVVEDIETGIKFVGAVSGGEPDMYDDWKDLDHYNSYASMRFPSAKALFDIAKRLYYDRNADISDLEKDLFYERACVCVLPKNGSAYNKYDFFTKENPYFLYSKNPTVEMPFASTLKVLTSLTAFDYISDLSETLTIKESDLAEGSGPALVAGQVYTFRDAFYALFLPSSNSMCQAVARVVGHKILKISSIK